MINKKQVLTAVIFFILGVIITNQYNQTQVKGYKNITRDILNNCTDSLTAYNDLNNNCNETYAGFYSCITNLESCDVKASTEKGEGLKQGRLEIENRIKDLTNQTGLILERAKVLKN